MKAGHYILSDPEDKSQYSSAQRFTDNVMNPCLESTYNFLQHVVEQIIAMHKVSMVIFNILQANSWVPCMLMTDIYFGL